MLSKRTLLSLGLAATAAAQTTTEATLLLPDLCVTQSAPTVTVVNVQDTLTTYSYSCSIDSAAVSSASAKASQIAESAQNKASEVRASLATFLPGGFKEDKDIPEDRRRRAEGSMKRDSSFECYGFDAFDACIPWEITQGPSYWAVHYTGTNIAAVNQECTFGEGGVANGPATCTGSGRLDPEIWGDGDGSHTETFAKTEVDDFFIRNTVAVTMGGPQATGGGGPKGQNAHPGESSVVSP
jgi:hypothetical protein